MARELLTTQEVAIRYRLSTNWLAKARVSGTGPGFLKLGKNVRYDPVTIDAWLSAHSRTSTSESDPRHRPAKPATSPTSAPAADATPRDTRGEGSGYER